MQRCSTGARSALLYRVEGEVTLAGDRFAHRIAIALFDFKADLKRACAPREHDGVHGLRVRHKDVARGESACCHSGDGTLFAHGYALQ